MMKNKYAWIAVNLLASLGGCLYMIYSLNVNTIPDTFFGVVFMLALILLPFYWFYKTITLWLIFLRADDKNLDAALKDHENQ